MKSSATDATNMLLNIGLKYNMKSKQ